MQFSEELKKLIEKHPDIIYLIEKRDIKTLYKRLLGVVYPNYNASDSCVGEVYDLLMALGINPLEYITKMPENIIFSMFANQLVIPSNIVSIPHIVIANSRIDTIIIESNKIDIDSLLWLYITQINNLICNSVYIKFSYRPSTTFVDFLESVVNPVDSTPRPTYSVKFTFKKNARVYQDNAYRSIRKIIQDEQLDKKFDITLV